MTKRSPVSASPAAEPLVRSLTGETAAFGGSLSTSERQPVRLLVEARDASRFTRVDATLFLLALAVYAIARLCRLTSYGLFGDEVFTYWAADQSLVSLIASVRGDVVHPPLFYIVLKFWIDLGGSSILWLKLLPVLFSFAAIPPLGLLCRELKMRAPAINLTLGLIAFNSLLVNYAQELRMYSLLMTLTITSLWLFVRLINHNGGVAAAQLALTGVNLLLVCTHYYGWLIVALELVFILFCNRERARGVAIGVAAILCAFSPWALSVAREAKDKPERLNFVWNAPPAVSDFVGYYANLNGALSYRWKVIGTLLVMILFATPIVAWGRFALRPTRARNEQRSDQAAAFYWLATFAFAPAVISFCASHVLSQSVWAPRYLMIAAPAYLMMAAVSVFKLPSRRLGVTTGIVMLLWAAVSGSTEIINRDRIAWEPLVDQMISAESRDSAIKVYATDPNLGNTIQFYLDRLSNTRCEVVYENKLDNLKDDHFWVAHIRYKHETQSLPQQILREAGYEVGAGFEAAAQNYKGFLFPVWKR